MNATEAMNKDPIQDRKDAMAFFSRYNIGDALNVTEAMIQTVALLGEAHDALEILSSKLERMSDPETAWTDGGMVAARNTREALREALTESKG